MVELKTDHKEVSFKGDKDEFKKMDDYNIFLRGLTDQQQQREEVSADSLAGSTSTTTSENRDLHSTAAVAPGGVPFLPPSLLSSARNYYYNERDILLAHSNPFLFNNSLGLTGGLAGAEGSGSGLLLPHRHQQQGEEQQQQERREERRRGEDASRAASSSCSFLTTRTTMRRTASPSSTAAEDLLHHPHQQLLLLSSARQQPQQQGHLQKQQQQASTADKQQHQRQSTWLASLHASSLLSSWRHSQQQEQKERLPVSVDVHQIMIPTSVPPAALPIFSRSCSPSSIFPPLSYLDTLLLKSSSTAAAAGQFFPVGGEASSSLLSSLPSSRREQEEIMTREANREYNNLMMRKMHHRNATAGSGISRGMVEELLQLPLTENARRWQQHQEEELLAADEILLANRVLAHYHDGIREERGGNGVASSSSLSSLPTILGHHNAHEKKEEKRDKVDGSTSTGERDIQQIVPNIERGSRRSGDLFTENRRRRHDKVITCTPMPVVSSTIAAGECTESQVDVANNSDSAASRAGPHATTISSSSARKTPPSSLAYYSCSYSRCSSPSAKKMSTAEETPYFASSTRNREIIRALNEDVDEHGSQIKEPEKMQDMARSVQHEAVNRQQALNKQQQSRTPLQRKQQGGATTSVIGTIQEPIVAKEDNNHESSRDKNNYKTTKKKKERKFKKKNVLTPTGRQRRPKKPRDMPRRPLSAYNLFFRDAREEILNNIPSPVGNKKKEVEEKQEENNEGVEEGEKKPVDEEGKMKENKGKTEEIRTKETVCKSTKRKRGRPRIYFGPNRRDLRKPHGKIGFESLAKIIGQRWNSTPEEVRRHYQLLAEKDLERYKGEMSTYKKRMEAVGTFVPNNMKKQAVDKGGKQHNRNQVAKACKESKDATDTNGEKDEGQTDEEDCRHHSMIEEFKIAFNQSRGKGEGRKYKWDDARDHKKKQKMQEMDDKQKQQQRGPVKKRHCGHKLVESTLEQSHRYDALVTNALPETKNIDNAHRLATSSSTGAYSAALTVPAMNVASSRQGGNHDPSSSVTHVPLTACSRVNSGPHAKISALSTTFAYQQGGETTSTAPLSYGNNNRSYLNRFRLFSRKKNPS